MERAGSPRLGIPRQLYYFYHPGLWETFFGGLGMEVVLSHPSTKRTVEAAGAISEAEHCLPVKLFDAHLAEIADKVDLMWVPRILSTLKNHVSCPKLATLPDAARVSINGTAEVLTIDVDEGRRPLSRSLTSLGRRLGISKSIVAQATQDAIRTMGAVREKMHTCEDGPKAPRVLLLGHPYCLYDEFICGPILRKLRQLDVGVEVFQPWQKNVAPSFIKWDTANKMYQTFLGLAAGEFAGAIQVSSFNCGCDSMATEFFRTVAREKKMAYMMLVIDEHTALGGIHTRLEAFVDSLGW